MKANLAWERGLARPLVLDAIRQAVKSHRDRLGRWPTSKGDLRVRVGVDERSLKTVGKWDIRLVTAARDGSRARYSIMVKDSWEEWEATMPSADDDLILGHASGGGQAGE